MVLANPAPVRPSSRVPVYRLSRTAYAASVGLQLAAAKTPLLSLSMPCLQATAAAAAAATGRRRRRGGRWAAGCSRGGASGAA